MDSTYVCVCGGGGGGRKGGGGGEYRNSIFPALSGRAFILSTMSQPW